MMPVNFECTVDVTKSYEDEGRWIVEGYAATSDFDLQEDIITDEAIRASAKDLIENSTVLHNHNADEAIGRVLASMARKDGLLLKILISKTAPEIWQQITEGVLNKFSVRGKVLEARKQWVAELKRYARLILKMRLLEVSLVAVPANPKARAIRWYIEKALEEFEKAGGEIEPVKGGPEMGEQRIVEEELLEAGGDGSAGSGEKRKGGEAERPKGFPPPDQLEKEWSGHVEAKGLKGKGQEEVFEAWVAFCKQQGYPQPYPYPYPKPQSGVRMRQIVEFVDRLIKDEKDEARKKLLQEVRAIAAGAADAYPQPPARKEGADAGTAAAAVAAPGATDDGVEKAGRKIAGARLARLKKLLDELKGLIAEVDDLSASTRAAQAGAQAAGAAAGTTGKGADTDATLSKIAKALGISEAEDGEVPDLAKTVGDLKKRLDDLENTPASKTSLDGQEDLADEGKDGKGKDKDSVWKGLV